jgi:hypothetical protein
MLSNATAAHSTVAHDPRRALVQAKPEGDVIIDALTRKRAEQDEERQQRDQQPRT